MAGFKRIRKWIYWLFGTFLGLILILLVLGYLFEDKIHLMAIRELGKALNARIEVDDTHVSFFRSFPDVHVELEDVSINPVNSKGDHDVISLEGISLSIDFWSFFSDPMQIHSVSLEEPLFDLRRLSTGEWNLDDLFLPPSDSLVNPESTSEPITFDLRDVAIYDGRFLYHDELEDLYLRIDSIHLNFDGNFSAQSTHFDTELGLRIDDWRQNGVTWARDKHVNGDLLLDAELNDIELYRIREAELKLAEVLFTLGGEVSRDGGEYDLNLTYNTSRNDFDAFMSLLPGDLLHTGREYEYDGRFQANGWVRGTFGDGLLPDVHAEYAVENGSFHYTDYDSRLSGIGLKGQFDYHPQAMQESSFRCEDFTAQLRSQPFSGHFFYDNFNDPKVDCELKGKLALADLREFYPAFAEQSQASGSVDLDLAVRGRVTDFQEARYQRVQARGKVILDRVQLQDSTLQHPVEDLSGTIVLDNSRIQVNQLRGEIGNSDFAISGIVSNYLPRFFGQDVRLEGRLELQSQNLDLDDWLQEESGNAGDGSGDRFAYHLPDRVLFNVRADIGTIGVAKFEAHNVRGRLRLQDKKMKLDRLQMEALAGNMIVTGEVEAVREDLCRVRIDAEMNNIDINQTFRTFDQLAAFALVEENLFGTFSGNLHISGDMNQYLDLDPASLISYGDISLKNGRLVNFEPLEGLAGFVKLEDLRDIQFSDVSTSYRIESEYFYIPQLSLLANRYLLDVRGRHGFDNTLDYHVAITLPRKEARQSQNQDVLEMVQVAPQEKAKITIPVHITGTADEPRYALDGGYVRESLDQKVEEEKEELKEAVAQEIQDEFGGSDSLAVEDLIEVEAEERDSSKTIKGMLDKIGNPLKGKLQRRGSRRD